MGDQRLKEINNYVWGVFSNTPLSDFQYTYNTVGTLATWQQQIDNNTPTQYALGYDNADQLKSAVQTDTSTTATVSTNAYNYDPAGNRLAETTLSGTTGGQFNQLNQLTGLGSTSSQTIAGNTSASVTNVMVNAVPASISNATNFSATVPLPTGTNVVSVVAQPTTGDIPTTTQRVQVVTTGTAPAALTYDANGNTLTDEIGNAYTWDALNRLISITYTSGASSTFAYDGLSRRVQMVEKDASSAVISTKNYLWIGSAMAEERDVSNVVTKRFFPQGEQQAGTSYYYTSDHLGSVREMLNSSGTIVARYDYDPYGRTTLVSGSNVATFQYAGTYAHQASQLEFAVYRTYDSTTGRWLARDPLGEGVGPNLYDYVGNDPIDGYDPLGLLTVHFWAPYKVNDHGHISITLDDGTYISNWPDSNNLLNINNKMRTPSYNQDNAEETIAHSTVADLYIGTLDEAKIKDWWNKKPKTFYGIGNNCSTTTADALRAGGLPLGIPWLYTPSTIWPLINQAVNDRKNGGAGGSW